MELERLFNSKLFYIVIFLFLTPIISFLMYQSKTEEQQQDMDIIQSFVVPSSIISLVIVFVIYVFKGTEPKEIILDKEEFFD